MANKKKNKLTREQKEAIDNKIVLATAIALISAMALLFIYRWLNVYPVGTRRFVLVLAYLGTAGVLFSVGMYFWKKERKYLFLIPYFAVGSFFCLMITNNIFYSIARLAGITIATKHNFIMIYVCLAVYLIASYIYYGLKLRRK